MSAAIMQTSTLGSPAHFQPVTSSILTPRNLSGTENISCLDGAQKLPRGGHCLFRPPSSTAGDIADRSLSIKPAGAHKRKRACGLMRQRSRRPYGQPPAFRKAGSLLRTSNASRVVLRCTRPLRSTKCATHDPGEGNRFCENRQMAVRAACRRG
jgi:hypothetical protein